MIDNALVIDDDPVFCEMAKSYLEQLRVKGIFVAHDGAVALQTLTDNSNQIDFIILDINMPEMDGIQLLGKLKELSFSGSIAIVSGEVPVIMNMAESLGNQYGLNVVDAVRKPLTKADMDRWFAGQNDCVGLTSPD